MHRSLASVIMLVCCLTAAAEELTTVDINNIYKTRTHKAVSVHDPSVVHTTGQTFYIIGSHRGWATSTDNMVNWTGLNCDNLFGKLSANGTAVKCAYADAFSDNATKTVRALVGGQPQDVAFGPFDAKAWANADQADWNIDGNMWAPDLIYNPNSGKWMMYMSINGDNWHSVIVLLTADKITGPYVYQGPVHYSGFINGTNAAISWKKTDLELVIGTQNSLPARYNKGSDWGRWWTNDIDPCVFFDEQGELWMTYGSWSGGIFIIRLDKQTGLRDYTYTYPTENDGQGRALSDPYFGKRIAGGYYSSGEGSYIQHIGNYYYLFMSYGGFAPDGGYEMRIFRSATPDGMYVDATDHDACYHDRYWLNYGPGAQTNGGMKLMGAYNGWGLQTVGECAQGHNSATADGAGRNFVVYHTKFNNGTAGHQVRVRQLLLNSDGWPCAAPFEFDGETETDQSVAAGCRYTKDEIAGTYDVLIHRYKMNHDEFEEVTPVTVTLTANGRIEGDLTGSWSMTNGTAYISLKAGSTTYNGVVVQQTLDGTTLPAIGITAQAKSGVSLWAFRLENKAAVAYAMKNYTFPVKNNQTINRHLPLGGYTPKWGATVEWTSSRPDVISNTGEYSPISEDVSVTLTCRIAAGNDYYEQSFNVKALRATTIEGDFRTDIAAYYDCEQKPLANAYNTAQTAYFGHAGQTQSPTLVADATRYGNVLHQWAGAAKAESFMRITNPLASRTEMEGFTIATWIKPEDADDLWSTLWSITDKQGNLAAVSKRLYLTGNAALYFITSTDTFAINMPQKKVTGYIPAGTWSHVVVTASVADGVAIYVNGSRKSHTSFVSTASTSANVTQAAKAFDYNSLIDFVKAAGFIQTGVGGRDGSAAADFDDILIYARALTANDVKALYAATGRRTDFTPAGADAIHDVTIHNTESAPSNGGNADGKYYDLSGRPATANSSHGIKITRGRKIYNVR